MSVYESQTPAERRKRRRRRSEDLLQSWKTLSSFRGRTQSPHYIKVPEDVCVHILVQASSCGPIRVLLSVIWGHFVQASLGQTWDCLFRFKVSIRTGVYSKVWIMDLTKANVCVCVSQLCSTCMYGLFLWSLPAALSTCCWAHIRDSNTHICPSITARPLINRMLSWLPLGFIHGGYFLSNTLCSLEKSPYMSNTFQI